MAFDEALASRIRNVLAALPLQEGEATGEIKMFGGLCFTLNRKMLVGTGKRRLMVRLSDNDLRNALESGKAEPMDFTGKPLRNFAYIKEEGYSTDEDLFHWIVMSTRFVRKQLRDKGSK